MGNQGIGWSILLRTDAPDLVINSIVTQRQVRDNTLMKYVDTTIRLASDDDQKNWNNRVSHPLQSWEWGEFRKKMGVDVVRLIADQERWQLTFHRVPYTPWTIGYFPKGPVPSQQMVETLKDLGREKRAIFIQLEPNTTATFKLLPPSHHPLFTKFTFVLDLTKSEEELLSVMHSKTRYNIKVAQKNNVLIKQDHSQEAFAQYLKLSQQTTQRQGFYAHNRLYHERMWQTLHKAGIASLWSATYKGSTLAAWIIFAFKDTIYYPYGASSREHREAMAPSLLLWEITRWGKSNGYNKFDLWGALGPNPNEKDRWYGFHRFKAGFNPALVECIGSYDLIVSPFLYKGYQLTDIIRWKLLKHH